MAMSTLVASAAFGGRSVRAANLEAPTSRDASDLARVAVALRKFEQSAEPLYPIVAAFHNARVIDVLLVPDHPAIGAALGDLQAGPASPNPQVRRFDIPAGPLGTVLALFERATGIVISVPNADLRTLASPGVTGLLSPEAALRQLLAGTGVSFRLTSSSTAVLELRAAPESVDVTATPSPASPKYTQPLRDLPQTITVIPARVIDAQGATTLRDVLRNVSGITFQAGEGGVPAGDQMTIRGFSARTDMFVDGVRDFGGYSRDPFNMEQVEVAKGPSSAISGRGSTGGAINQVSKTANLGTSRGATVSLGNADTRRTTVDLNEPLRNVGLESGAVRLNAMWTEGGVPGRDVVHNERWGLAPSMSLGLGTRWSPTK
jgi:catecholate siderophore receptor